MKSIISVFAVLLTLNCFSEDPAVLCRKGVEYANSGRFDDAISEFKKAIDANPNKAELHYSLGVVYANKKEYDNAERELETAISINPGNIQAHYVLAMIYEKKKKNDKAVSEWQKVSDLTQEKELKKHAEKHIKRLKETK